MAWLGVVFVRDDGMRAGTMWWRERTDFMEVLGSTEKQGAGRKFILSQ